MVYIPFRWIRNRKAQGSGYDTFKIFISINETIYKVNK